MFPGLADDGEFPVKAFLERPARATRGCVFGAWLRFGRLLLVKLILMAS